MKRTIILLLLMIPFIGAAQSGYTYIVPSAGVTLQESGMVRFGIEYNNRYYEGWEIVFEATLENNGSNEEAYLGGIYFEPLLFRNRDVLSNLRFGVLGGSQQQQIAIATGGGIELSFVLRGNIILSIQQDTKLVFGADRNFRHGVLLALKIPI
ncbi:MAG: hypothetical protein AAF039_18345 [Bacteroidota bacterium]